MPNMTLYEFMMLEEGIIIPKANEDGGPGSGNFGHQGREGKVGGSAPGPFHTLSNRAKEIIQEHLDNPMHFGKSDEQKSAAGKELAKELEAAGVKVIYDKDEYLWPYNCIGTNLTYEENCQACAALNQTQFGPPGFSVEDYVSACREAGVEPRLSERPVEIPEHYFATKSGKIQKDDTPVYSRLSKERLLSDGEILRFSGSDPAINPEGAEAARKASEAAIESMSDEELKAVHGYTKQYGGATYQNINHYLATGEGSEQVKKAAELMTSALDHEIGVDCITGRGARQFHGLPNDEAANKLLAQVSKGNFSHAGKLSEMLEGKTVTSDVVMSATPGSTMSGFDSLPVQMVFKTPADAKAVNITAASAFGGGRSEVEKKLAATGLFGTVSHETEVAFKPGTRYRIDRVAFSTDIREKKKNGQVYLVCTILTDNEDSRTDGGPGSGNFGHEGREGQVGGSAPGKGGPQLSSSMKAKNSYTIVEEGYPLDDQEFIHKNLKALMPIYEEGGGDAVDLEYWKALTEYGTQDVHELDQDPHEVHEEFIEAVGDNYLAGWFVKADPDYKPIIARNMLSNPKARNMALNQMYTNYQHWLELDAPREGVHEEPKSFAEFMTTPVKLYRGGSGKAHDSAATFSAYTFSKAKAQEFAGKDGQIYELTVRPVDTWGGWQRGNEYEVMVPYWIAPNGNLDHADGGPGSGNHGHKGVPGQVGGSAPTQGSPLSSEEKKAIVHFTGDNKAVSQEKARHIEAAIVKAKPLDDQYEYSRGFTLTKQQLDDLIENGIYAPGRLTSWTPDESVAASFAEEGTAWDDSRYPVVVKYRGTKQLDKGMEVSQYSQHPDEDEVVFSSAIRMRVEKSEITGYDPEDDFGPSGVVYINLYDDDRTDGGPGSGNHGHKGVPGQRGGSAPSVGGPSSSKAPSEARYKALIPKKSYSNTTEYKSALSRVRDLHHKETAAYARSKELQAKLDEICPKKPKSEWTEEEQIDALLGDPPRHWNDEGRDLNKQIKAALKESHDAGHEFTSASEDLSFIKATARQAQVKAWDSENHDLVPAQTDEYEGFTTESTGLSGYDEWLGKNSKYAKVCEMSPEEYLKRCAYDIFETGTIESTIQGTDPKAVEKYTEMMASGTRFDLPYLNYADHGQEGRHRALAAYNLGIKKIPVLVIGYDKGTVDFEHKMQASEYSRKKFDREHPGWDDDIDLDLDSAETRDKPSQVDRLRKNVLNLICILKRGNNDAS